MALEIARDARHEARRTPRRAQTVGKRIRASARGSKQSGVIRAAVPEHAVFLIPGLLGFESFATFTYFADRMVAALRAGLERALNQPVPVVAVPIPPTASLRDRQRRVVRILADRLHVLEHDHPPLQVHLVGHSTGGVDAELLTYDRPLGGGSWRDLEPRAPELRDRIRSIVSIGSPHQGASITVDPVGRLVQDPLTSLLRERDPRGVFGLFDLLGKFGLSAARDIDTGDLLFGAKREMGKSVRFLSQVLREWQLVGDLEPTRQSLSPARRSDVTRRSFVTIAGSPRPGSGAHSHADPFFRALSKRASGWRTGSAHRGDHVMESVERLQEALAPERSGELVIKAEQVELPSSIDAGHNDGLVNSARQLIDPRDPDELAGIVVADHFDVVGYYDRRVWRVDSSGEEHSARVLSGLLHSGSVFRDREFFDLYRRVAEVIAATV